jgi:type III restriction enzyme
MPQTIIENPIINRPFEEPTRHFKFDDDGITNQIIDARRPSEYFIPIARPKKKNAQLALDQAWVEERREENRMVNDIRARVAIWRMGGYAGVTPTTRRLLEYWIEPDRERKFFYCQIEALETAIYLTECANRFNDQWIANRLAEATELYNPGLSRAAFKMATGSGKTVVMAMLIAWQTLNKLDNPQDTRFSDVFLIVTPGITIRDRLGVLMPNASDNYYEMRDIVPNWQMELLNRAQIVITNFHAFQLREKGDASKTTKAILGADRTKAFQESPAQMVNRVLAGIRGKKSIIVINDESHHCYRRKQDTTPAVGELLAAPATSNQPASHAQPTVITEKLTGEDRKEAEQRNEEARIWISGLEAVNDKIGIKRVFDLSATPFFLRGSGEPEGTLFPWVVSDFSLIDAIESGIVKIPRVPVSDNAMTGELPTNRELWNRIRESLPRKGAKTDRVAEKPVLPKQLEAALQMLYDDYEDSFRKWERTEKSAGAPPPVFIIVCNNTNVSRMVYNYVGGWERELEPEQKAALGRESIVQAGALEHFRNDNGNGDWLDRPNTILIDSAQLESGNAMSPEFKAIAGREIEEFKHQYRLRYNRDADDISDGDLLREVMNSVGKEGRLGEHVRCVVSVSMLTEGWDANTVTHILGVRPFGTQLLCEQVVGRALRRTSYATDEQGYFSPEYAEVFGVPFSFIPTTGETLKPPVKRPTRVRALDDRIDCEITFPRVIGYRYKISDKPLAAAFDDSSYMVISPEDVPTTTENRPILGETNLMDLRDRYGHKRMNEVSYEIARYLVNRLLIDTADGDAQPKPWLFPDALRITREWLDGYVRCKDEAFPQLLLLAEFMATAANKIRAAIVRSDGGESTLMPILRPYDAIGSTRYVDFDTTKPVFVTDPGRCHISHVVADTAHWEQKMASVLQEHPRIVKYVKNQGLGFEIPYTFEDTERKYTPDFIVCIDDGHGPEDLLSLVLEVSGEARKDKTIKVETARDFWLPAINNHGGFGRWAFTNVTDPWEAESALNALIGAAVPT